MQPRCQATLTQPLQCVLQHHVANLHISTHMATPDDNNPAAIPIRSATTDSKTPYNYARTSTPKAAWSHPYNAAKKKANRPQPQPPHGGTFHHRLQPLDTEKHKVSCSGFLPNTNPMQHSCSHYNAFCSITSQTCTYLRTWQRQMTTIMQPFQCDLQPQIPQHPITTHAQAHPKQLEATLTMRQKERQTDHSRNRRTQEVPFIIGCSHLTRKNTRFRAPASSPTQAPCNVHAGQFFCDVLLCSVKSHTALHQGQFFCDVLLCSVKSHTALHQGQFFCDVLLFDVKSHTALHQGQFFCDVLLCDVATHTTLHQGQASQF